MKPLDFFEQIADDYSKKLDGSDPLLTYFFNQRIEAAAQLVDFQGVTLLDIGAGTGALLDFLDKTGRRPAVYFATDISKRMLAASRIPPENRFVGPVWLADFPQKKFEVVAMLGVSTYLNDDEWRKNVASIREKLAENGSALISFTNRNSLDFQLRRLIKPIARLLSFNKKLLSSNIEIRAVRFSEIERELAADFTLERVVWLNQTIFPFNRLAPRLAVFLAKTFFSTSIFTARYPFWLPFFSSDFLVKIRLR